MNSLQNLIATMGLASILLSSSVVNAAPYLPGDVQLLEDEDAEIVLNPNGTVKDLNPAGGTPYIAVGDLFAGVFKIQATQNVNDATSINLQGNTPTFTAIFLIKATSITPATLGTPPNTLTGNSTTVDGFDDTLTFGAATQAEWNSVFGAGGTIDISSVFDVGNINGSGSGIAAGTAAMLFNGVLFDNAQTADGNPALPNPTLADSVIDFISGGSLEYEFGFAGAAGEFWSTIGKDAAIPATTSVNKPTNRLSLNITKQWNGPDLLKHNYLGTGTIPPDTLFTDPVHLQAFGSFQPLQAGSPWGLGTDTNVYINSVPEPASLALLSIGLMGFGVAGGRRKALM